MPNLLLYPYSNKTKGGKALMSALGTSFKTVNQLQLFVDPAAGATPGKSNRDYTLINWGNGTIQPWATQFAKRVLNSPKSVSLCGNKVNFFKAQEASSTPARTPTFTTELDVALEWVKEGLPVLGRSTRGSCGLDIAFYEDNPERFNDSEFWVQYKKKKEEYRIHIVGKNVIATQKKSLRTEDDLGQKIDNSTVDFRIRNHRNGFIFKRNDISVPGDVVDQAILAFNNVGLDFGAVDVIWNQYEGKAYVLEINTAPGLEGTTVTDYAAALKSL